jgi:lipid-A-disaccharide synthase
MRVMVSCGEPSGDLYAAALTTEIRRRAPAAEVFGLGGTQFREAGGRLVADFSAISVTGLTEALRVLPRSFRLLRRLEDEVRERRPDVLVAIDFPDFNFRLMAAIHQLGIPVVYYVSPQLWAWRPGRMKTMKRLVERVLVIFPFEEAIYRDAGVDARFVGHPLVDLAQPRESREAFLRARGLDPAAPVVALLPGSRRNEVQRILPGIAAAVPLIAARVPAVQFVVAAAPNLSAELFAPFAGLSPGPAIVAGRADDVLAASDVVVTASGTATVQAALHERPMVVVYRLSGLTYRIGKPFVKVDTYAMVNLVAGRRVVPELIQDDFTPERVADEAVGFLLDSRRYSEARAALREVRARLGEPGASGRAAEAVLEVASRAGARSA